ncbi:RNA-directed DNA polymerase, eukaryota, nucleotide-binding alpha-beta plait domain protein [Tanacetum coccineum]
MGGHIRKSYNYKEDQTSKISKSVFGTNFPDHIRAQDLWNVCNEYSSVVDAYIPSKRSKTGKRYAFILFIKVFNLERLIENLNTIWIGSYHLHANKVLFERKQNSKDQINDNHPGIIKTHAPTAIHPVLDDSCTKEHDFIMSLMGKVNEVSAIPNLYIVISKEGFQSVKLTYLGGLWVLIELDSLAAIEKFSNHVGVGTWFSLIKPTCNSFVSDERIVWVSLEGLPIRAWTDNMF